MDAGMSINMVAQTGVAGANAVIKVEDLLAVWLESHYNEGKFFLDHEKDGGFIASKKINAALLPVIAREFKEQGYDFIVNVNGKILTLKDIPTEFDPGLITAGNVEIKYRTGIPQFGPDGAPITNGSLNEKIERYQKRIEEIKKDIEKDPEGTEKNMNRIKELKQKIKETEARKFKLDKTIAERTDALKNRLNITDRAMKEADKFVFTQKEDGDAIYDASIINTYDGIFRDTINQNDLEGSIKEFYAELNDFMPGIYSESDIEQELPWEETPDTGDDR